MQLAKPVHNFRMYRFMNCASPPELPRPKLPLTGTFAAVTNLGGGTLLANAAAASDIFVAKYSPAGTHLWSQAFGNFSANQGNDVAVDGSGNVVVTGQFVGADFGSGPLTSAGGYDIFLFKHAP